MLGMLKIIPSAKATRFQFEYDITYKETNKITNLLIITFLYAVIFCIQNTY